MLTNPDPVREGTDQRRRQEQPARRSDETVVRWSESLVAGHKQPDNRCIVLEAETMVTSG